MSILSEISLISLQLSGDVFGLGLTTGPASSGLLSYYPEYTSFGEFLSGIYTGLVANFKLLLPVAHMLLLLHIKLFF